MNQLSALFESQKKFYDDASPTVRRRRNWRKRLFDIIFSTIALSLLCPILLILIALIRIHSPGKAIYSQIRVGRRGRRFKCYKLRTMYCDADKRLQELLQSDEKLRLEWQQTQKLRHDPRIIGRLGRFLRKTSLDELPQFWNVLIGDLSVVGPRPMVPDEIQERLGSKARKILTVRPGLTGIWQTSGRSEFIDYAARIAMDETYVDQHTLISDLVLIFKTIPCMLFSKGA